MRTSILILNWNGLDVLAPCLAAIERNTPADDYEVIVLDNGSEEAGVEQVVRPFPKVRLIKEAVNHGFSRGNNLAAAQARGQFLVILNNDTVPGPGWLEPLLASLVKGVGIAGARLVDRDGRVHFAGAYFDPAISAYARLFRHYPPEAVTAPRECEAYIACGIALRRELFESVGGFDEGYFQGYEDMDLCLKVRERGLKIEYCPDSVIEHIENVSMNRMRRTDRRKHKEDNRRRFELLWNQRIHEFRLPPPAEGRADFESYEWVDEGLVANVRAAGSVLHLGCGTGQLGKRLKDLGKATRVTGVEEDRTAITLASRLLDQVVHADLEQASRHLEGPFDTVLLSLRLERMRDPWEALRQFASHLREGGQLVARFHNVVHYKLLKRLAFRDWRYEPEGLLAESALRFFSRGSIEDLLQWSGFEITELVREENTGPAWRLLRGSWVRARELTTSSFIVKARRRSHSAVRE